MRDSDKLEHVPHCRPFGCPLVQYMKRSSANTIHGHIYYLLTSVSRDLEAVDRLTRHVVAASVLLDVNKAIWTLLGSTSDNGFSSSFLSSTVRLELLAGYAVVHGSLAEDAHSLTAHLTGDYVSVVIRKDVASPAA